MARRATKTVRGLTVEESQSGIHTLAMELWLYTPEGTPSRRIVGNLVGEEWVRVGSPPTLMPRPFAAVSLVAARHRTIVGGDSGGASLRVFGPAGEQVRRIVPPVQGRASGPHVDAYRDARLTAVRSRAPSAVAAMGNAVLVAWADADGIPGVRIHLLAAR